LREKEANMSQPHIALRPENSTILLIDYQPGVLAMVNSLPREIVAANAGILARLGERTRLPLVVTSTREEMGFLGTNIDEIKDGAPTAFANRIARGGYLDAFADSRFVEAVQATGRHNLVMAGVLTDVCLWHSAVSALEAGYHVQVVADASGTTTELADRATYDRLRDLGVEVSTTFGTVFELFPDLSTPAGLLAESIVSGQDRVALAA
jgi:nicotinamidase-related amidase